jgi:hypothetical protein
MVIAAAARSQITPPSSALSVADAKPAAVRLATGRNRVAGEHFAVATARRRDASEACLAAVKADRLLSPRFYANCRDGQLIAHSGIVRAGKGTQATGITAAEVVVATFRKTNLFAGTVFVLGAARPQFLGGYIARRGVIIHCPRRFAVALDRWAVVVFIALF